MGPILCVVETDKINDMYGVIGYITLLCITSK